MSASRAATRRTPPKGSSRPREREPRERPASDGGAAATSRLSPALDAAGALAERWAPTAGRMLLGLVLAWFGYHELVSPGMWTGYVPVVSATSHLAQVLVLAHGWLLLVLAVALLGGVAPRIAAAAAAVLLLEIVISLTVTGGLSDLVLRDVGVFGLAVTLTGMRKQQLVLRR